MSHRSHLKQNSRTGRADIFTSVLARSASYGAAVVPVTSSVHEIATDSAGDALTLADGTSGQQMFLVYAAEDAGGDTAILTPANLAGGTTVTFNALGDTAHLIFVSGNWYFIAGSAVLA